MIVRRCVSDVEQCHRALKSAHVVKLEREFEQLRSICRWNSPDTRAFCCGVGAVNEQWLLVFLLPS